MSVKRVVRIEQGPSANQPDIVQVQKEVWAQIAREEREGKRRPPEVRWGSPGKGGAG